MLAASEVRRYLSGVERKDGQLGRRAAGETVEK